MTDIRKYLESQQALAQKKSKVGIMNKHNTVSISERSRKSADLISKKQKRGLSVNEDCSQKKLPEEASVHQQRNEAGPSSSYRVDMDSGSEYVPSSDDEDEHISLKWEFVSSVRNSRVMKKVTDDGDKKMYHLRTEKWKKNLRIIRTQGRVLAECDILTADVRYLMDGSDDSEEEHELPGGLRIPKYVWKQLYKYQRTGVKWLWELHQLRSGGLLGDEMGLGKTIQIIAFLVALSKTDVGTWGGLGPTIVVTPATVIYQWVSHFHYWFPGLRVGVLHNTGSHSGRHHSLLKEIYDAHGVLLITYAGVVKYNSDVLNYNWHYVVLDEGHKIRNPDTQVSKMVKKFKTPHKILITGSPMQNSLQELWSLFDFMSPGLLGTQAAFMEFFAMPITQGGYSNATQLQEVTAYEIAKSLKNIITPYMIRRTKAEVQEHIQLPEKNEQVLFCSLSQEQRDLYLGYLLGGTVRSILDKDKRYGDPLRARILVAISTLRKICNHPDLYLYEAHDKDEPVAEDNFGHWRRAGKMAVVQSLLKIWNKQGHRALIFSQSRAMLCILEQFLLQSNYSYLKMDGTVSVGLRQNIIKTFNENTDYLVFLATTRVGGIGVNLTGADRVIIYDPDWNPATDSQAKERAWRIGQRRNVTIYRLLSAGTIEEKIFQRQVFKHLLGNKVLIDPNQKNPLKTSHLQGLFTLEEPNRDGDTETATIFSHTKVDVEHKEENKGANILLSGGMSFSMKKMAAMRKRAREISRKIARENAVTPIDAREIYKNKRELLLNPPKIDEMEINIIDDDVTDMPFAKALSEVDIINLHSKKDYLEKLLKQTTHGTEQNKNSGNEDGELTYEIMHRIKPKSEEELLDTLGQKHNYIKKGWENKYLQCSNETVSTKEEGELEDENAGVLSNDDASVQRVRMQSVHKFGEKHIDKDSINETEGVDLPTDRKRKKPKSQKYGSNIEGLVYVKKIKKKHRDKYEKLNDNDYVLTKLFAKSGLQSALEHDKIVGLVEKEEQHRLKEVASKKAKEALKAIKKSIKRSRFESVNKERK